MDISRPLPLLGGLTPDRFMRRHWQKKPLLVRQAMPGIVPPVARQRLFELAGEEGVESRMVEHDARRGDEPEHRQPDPELPARAGIEAQPVEQRRTGDRSEHLCRYVEQAHRQCDMGGEQRIGRIRQGQERRDGEAVGQERRRQEQARGVPPVPGRGEEPLR